MNGEILLLFVILLLALVLCSFLGGSNCSREGYKNYNNNYNSNYNNNSNNNYNNNSNYNSNYNSSNNVTVLGTIGATGYGSGNSFVGYAGIVTNLGENYNAPTLNTNIDYSSNSNQPAQTNGVEINNTNDVPGYGQGGVGGWNSNNNNGYPGQNGGSALVRVYYMA